MPLLSEPVYVVVKVSSFAAHKSCQYTSSEVFVGWLKALFGTPPHTHLSNVGFRGQRLTISVVFLKSTIQHSLSPWLTRHAATRFELLFPALFSHVTQLHFSCLRVQHYECRPEETVWKCWPFSPHLGYIPPAYVYDSWIFTLKLIEYHRLNIVLSLNYSEHAVYSFIDNTHKKYMYYHISKTWRRHNSQVTFYNMAHGMGTHASDWQVQ